MVLGQRSKERAPTPTPTPTLPYQEGTSPSRCPHGPGPESDTNKPVSVFKRGG